MATTVRSVHDGGQNRTSITILVLGDEGVGKSSLISTFVSRHFSEVVPGIMTRVRLPPDPGSSCITTIVDSQGGDGALMSAVAALSLAGGGGAAGIGGNTAVVDSAGGGVRNSASSISTLQKSLTNSTTTAGSASTGHVGGGGGIENVDSIVLIYDLDRVETFYRLENHWLPLIERCYNGELPVIVAGNKMDLFRPSSTTGVTDEQVLARSRQQIVSLMQRFRFIRQCIKCSAKNLLRVDEVFSKAQQAVLYPFNPLYNLEIGRLSDNCQRAFTRIFRMYDQDNDGLLSDSELDKFQHETFHFPIYERDFTGWKKVVSRNNPTNEEVVRDGKFTVFGFLAIFDVFISQNRLDVPWQALRKFGYDDNLVLTIPETISSSFLIDGADTNEKKAGGGLVTTQQHHHPESDDWALSPEARKFLTDLFHQFDSNHDGILSPEDVQKIFSIIPEASLPPWHPFRASVIFRGCFSIPKEITSTDTSSTDLQQLRSTSEDEENDQDVAPSVEGDEERSPGQSLTISTQSLSASGITIVSGETYPTLDLSTTSTIHRGSLRPISKPLSFLDWMGLWHAVTAISASRSRAELFRLGHMEDSKRGKRRGFRSKKNKSPINSLDGKNSIDPDALLPSHELRVLLLGSAGSGKTALLNSICCVVEGDAALRTVETKTPETSSAYVRLKRKNSSKKSGKKVGEDETFVVHLIFTEVPEVEVEVEDHANNIVDPKGSQKRKEKLAELLYSSSGMGGNGGDAGCDLVALAFDTTSSSSLTYAKEIEDTLLTEDMPRVYVGTKVDELRSKHELDEDTDIHSTPVVGLASIHCRALDLEPPVITSAGEAMLNASGNDGLQERRKFLNHLARCCLPDDSGVQRLRSKPHEEEKRREADRRRNRKLMWFGVGGIVAVVVVGYLWAAGAASKGSGGGGSATTGGTGASAGGSGGGEQKSGAFRGWLRWFSRPIASDSTPAVSTT